MPAVGGSVLVEYLDATIRGTVSEIAGGGRRLTVVTEDHRTLTFALNRATATFTADGGQTGPRLRFDGTADRAAGIG
jgi:hypothetical protein